MTEEILKRIDSKLAALLAITVDQYLRDNPDVAKPRHESIDQLLVGVGLPVKDVAALLNKSEQAVYQMLNRTKKSAPKTRGQQPAGDEGKKE